MTNANFASMIMDEISDIVYLADLETYELIYINNTTLNILGNPKEKDWKGKKCYQTLQNQPKPCPFCTNHLLRCNEYYIWEYYNQSLDRYFSIKDKIILLGEQRVRLEIATDITAQALTDKQLRQKLLEEQTLVSCVQTLNEGSNGKESINHLLQIVGTYHKAERAYIFEFNGNIINNTYEWCREDISPQIHNLQNVPIETVERWFEQFKRSGDFYISSLGKNVDKDSLEYKILDSQGIESLMAAALWQDNEIIGFVGVDNPTVNTEGMFLMRSVTSFITNDLYKRKMMEKLTALSYTDALTGTGNRHDYYRVINGFSNNPPASLGIIFLDINGLKIVNDTYGHKQGDYLIKHLAKALLSIFMEYVYRIGGDEFVVLCQNMSQEDFLEKVAALRRLVETDKGLPVSMGISWEKGTVDVARQITCADGLMYEEKQQYYARLSKEKNKGKYCHRAIQDEDK